MQSLFKKIFASYIAVFALAFFGGCAEDNSASSVNEVSTRPCKYFTIAFDDGITQDTSVIKLLKKYDIRASFYINTGLTGVNSKWVGIMLGDTTITHQRFSNEEIKSGIYDGFDVESHSLTHKSLTELSSQQVVAEISIDMKNIKKLTGIKPIGFAFPGAFTKDNNSLISLIKFKTDVKFIRSAYSTHSFELPTTFFPWDPTTSLADNQLLDLTKDFIEAPLKDSSQLLFIWGHSFELNTAEDWQVLEEIFKLVSKDKNIKKVTNAEFYNIFKSSISSKE